MYKYLIGQVVTIVVSSRGQNLLEYIGTLQSENEEAIVLSGVNISYLMANFQKGIFGEGISKYKENLSTVILNKKYIISCNR